jgi:hypothetical protein
MTLGELKSTVSTYCDTNFSSISQYFIPTVNEALLLCYSYIKPVEKKYTIVHIPLTNSITENYDMQIYNPKSGLVYSGNGKAYYFEVNGNGTATITSDLGNTVITFTKGSVFSTYKGFCDGDTTITFSGTNEYIVRNIAIYKNVYSSDYDDIPVYSRYIRYDLSELVTDFGGFTNKDPYQGGAYEDNKDFKFITDYIKKQNTIYINREEKGEITIYYKSKPATIALDASDSYEIVIDDLLAQAFLYQICSKISFLDDEIERSNYFENEFNLVVANITEQNRIDNRKPAWYLNTTNWY